MKKIGMAVFLVAWMILLGGCGGGGPEAVAKEMVGAMDEVSSIFENSKDATEAKPKLEAVVTRMQDIKKRGDALKLDQNKEVQKKFEPELKRAMERMAKASMSFAQKDAKGFMELAEVMKKLAK